MLYTLQLHNHKQPSVVCLETCLTCKAYSTLQKCEAAAMTSYLDTSWRDIPCLDFCVLRVLFPR